MMFASFLDTNTKKKDIKFRGEDLTFWIKKKFFFLNFIETDNLSDNIDHILLFDPHKYLKIKKNDFDLIIDQLKKINNEKEQVFSLQKNPFYYLKKPSGIKQTDIVNLPKLKKIKNLSLEGAYEVYSLTEDQLDIENEIKKIQIQLFFNQNIEIDDFSNFYIEAGVCIGENSKIGSGVVIKGSSKIGKNVVIYPNVFINNSEIGDDTVILPGCVIGDSFLKGKNQIGPYAHLRNGVIVEDEAKIGNFVEMKKSRFGKGSKSMHLTYIGDSEIGEKVNIGAGTITCNYDGVNKNKTIIEDNVFIGSGSELIAPIKIGKNSYVAAGSTLTSNVPDDSLGVARQRQHNIEGWVKRKKRK